MANYAEYINREDAQSNSATRECAVANGVTVFNRDFVGYASGRVTSAGIATLRIIGMVMGGPSRIKGRSQRTAVGTSLSATGDVNGTVKVLVAIEPEAEYLLKASAALTAAQVGATFNLQGSAGSQLINATADAEGDGQFELVRLAEGMRGTDNTFGVFRIRKERA